MLLIISNATGVDEHDKNFASPHEYYASCNHISLPLQKLRKANINPYKREATWSKSYITWTKDFHQRSSARCSLSICKPHTILWKKVGPSTKKVFFSCGSQVCPTFFQREDYMGHTHFRTVQSIFLFLIWLKASDKQRVNFFIGAFILNVGTNREWFLDVKQKWVEVI